MATVCVACGLNVDETGRLYVEVAPGEDVAWPDECETDMNDLHCDEDDGLFVVKRLTSIDYVEYSATVAATYEPSGGTNQVVAATGTEDSWISLPALSNCGRVTYAAWLCTIMFDATNYGADYDVQLEIAQGTDPAGTFPGNIANRTKVVGGSAISGRNTWSSSFNVNQGISGPGFGNQSPPIAKGAADIQTSIRPRINFRTGAGGVYVSSFELELTKFQITDDLESRASGGATIP